jgi:casein kinase I family protein HRR25
MDLINNKYKTIKHIGNGSFGSIFKGENIRTKELVAIKVEPINQDIKLLKNESTIYQYLNNTEGIPQVKWFGKDNTNYYMIINLLGESLQSIKDKKHNFSLRLVLQIGVQIIYLLKTIHDKGIIHRDIKPDNFLLGLNSLSKKIHIIDFGFCKSYITNNIHNKIKKTSNLIGSLSYASINSHNCIELSRRDDLESLGYMLIYFYLGFLPWDELSSTYIKESKQNITKNDNIPLVLIDYIKYVTNLKYEENPVYSILIDMCNKEIDLYKKTN